MMIGKSLPEYIFIKTAIAALRLIAPLSMLYVAWMLLVATPASPHDTTWTLPHSCLVTCASLEAAFFICVYLPRRRHLQKAANHPTLSRDQRRALFQRCAAFLGSADYPAGWFFRSQRFRRGNVREWLLWALFSMSTRDAQCGNHEDEIAEYVAAAEDVLGRTLLDGYDDDVRCMRLTLDPVRMVHRPLLWYLIVGVVDAVTYLRLYRLGFRHYSDKRLFQTFPPRPLTLFSRTCNVEGLSYWYRPHHASERNPVLFLHGIGIGLFPYAGFLADLASRHPDVGIVVPEFLSISSRISPAPLTRPETVAAIGQILDRHAFARVVVAAHSYGTTLAAQLLRASPPASSTSPSPSPSRSPSLWSQRVAATLLVDPIPLLLHMPDVAFNFVYRAPRTANEWLLWFFASRDPDVARTLARHFFWAENVLWREELEGKVVAVALSGQDQLVNSAAVWRYLTGEGGDESEGGRERDEWRRTRRTYWRDRQLEVLCYPDLDHSMVFYTQRRWGRLMRVLDRFVRLPG